MTDIIYIVKDTYESEELDAFEFLIENKAMLGKRNDDRSLKLYHVNNNGKVYPKNKKMQAFIDVIGLKNLPLALTLKETLYIPQMNYLLCSRVWIFKFLNMIRIRKKALCQILFIVKLI